MDRFAKMLERYSYGIPNHCDTPIHTGKLKGVNNKIKVIKRKAYGLTISAISPQKYPEVSSMNGEMILFS